MTRIMCVQAIALKYRQRDLSREIELCEASPEPDLVDIACLLEKLQSVQDELDAFSG